MFNTTTIGLGLGFNANKLLTWGLGYALEFTPIKEVVVQKIGAGGGGGGGGDQRRTYLFLPRDIRFSIKMEGSLLPPMESTFVNPKDFVKGRVLAKKEPLFVKAIRKNIKDGYNQS